MVGALAALRWQSQAAVPGVEDFQRQIAALQEASQLDHEQFATDRRAWISSEEQARAISDARIQELEDTVSSLTQRSSELQRSMLEGARQREATAKEAQEREAALQVQLQAAGSHLEETRQQLHAAQEASGAAEAVSSIGRR